MNDVRIGTAPYGIAPMAGIVIDMAVDMLAVTPFHPGFALGKTADCVSCGRRVPISKARNCHPCGQMRQGYNVKGKPGAAKRPAQIRLQGKILIAGAGIGAHVFFRTLDADGEMNRVTFAPGVVQHESDEYLKAAFDFAMTRTDSARDPYVFAMCTTKQPLKAGNVALNMDPRRIRVSQNPDWGTSDIQPEIDLDAYATIRHHVAPTKGLGAKYAKENGVAPEELRGAHWKLHAIMTGQRKIYP